MVPDIAGTGHSFKGAMSYYLHDKRENGQAAHLSSTERVAWTETRNLATDDMRTAERIMIGTAKQADELKREAGIRNTGAKSNAHVYAYSLSWHPSERPDRAEMVRAADATLKALGAENRQAVIVCHTDREHPHVHVVVNRVDPNDGRMLSTSNDRRKLSDWANRYERECGTIFTPKREEQRQQREKQPDAAKRREYAEKARVTAQERAHDRKSQVGHLKALSQAQRDQHKSDWRQLSETNKAAREGIYRRHGDRIKDAIARHKAESKPIWREYYRQRRQRDQGYQGRERSFAGRVLNAWEAVKHRQETGQLEGRSLFSETVRHAFSSEARREAFQQAQDITRKDLSTRLQTIIDREVQSIQAGRVQALDTQRQTYQTQRVTLIERQTDEKAKLNEAWKAVRQEQPERQNTKPYWNERRSQEARQPNTPAKGRASFFELRDRAERQGNNRAPQENFFANKERVVREQTERPRPRSREQDRDR